MIDITKLSADERQTFRVYVAGGEGIGDSSGFDVVGPNSSEFLAVQSQIASLAMREVKNGTSPDIDTDAGAVEVIRQAQVRQNQVAVACVVGIFGFTADGEALPYSRANVEMLLTLRPRWALQITRAVENEANFTKG